MQPVTTVFSVITMGILGGLIGLIVARITSTHLTRKWKSRENQETIVEVASILTSLIGALTGGFAGSKGLAVSVLFLLIEINWIPAICLAIWVGAVTVRYAIKLSDRASNWLSTQLD